MGGEVSHKSIQSLSGRSHLFGSLGFPALVKVDANHTDVLASIRGGDLDGLDRMIEAR